MPATFKQGDVVERAKPGVSQVSGTKIDTGELGTVCRVITPGRSYRVQFASLDFCMLTFHDSIKKAPSGSVGPGCDGENCAEPVIVG